MRLVAVLAPVDQNGSHRGSSGILAAFTVPLKLRPLLAGHASPDSVGFTMGQCVFKTGFDDGALPADFFRSPVISAVG